MAIIYTKITGLKQSKLSLFKLMIQLPTFLIPLYVNIYLVYSLSIIS